MQEPTRNNVVGVVLGLVLHFTLAHLISSRWLRGTGWILGGLALLVFIPAV